MDAKDPARIHLPELRLRGPVPEYILGGKIWGVRWITEGEREDQRRDGGACSECGQRDNEEFPDEVFMRGLSEGEI